MGGGNVNRLPRLSTLINQLGKIAVDGAFYDAITNAPTIPDVNHCPPPPQPENRKWNREKSTTEGLVNENDAEALRTMTDVDVDV